MLAAGMGLVTFGYALLYVGVQRFRGNKISVIESLGGKGGTVTTVSGSNAGSTTPSSDTSGGLNVVPATGSTSNNQPQSA